MLEYKLHQNILKHHYDPNSLAEYIQNSIDVTIRENQRQVRTGRHKSNACEWMNEEVQNLIQRKDHLRTENKVQPTNSTQQQLENVSKQLRNAKRVAKRQYDQSLFEHSGDRKQTWKNLNKLLGRQKKSPSIARIMRGNDIFQDKKAIANELNNFFSSTMVKKWHRRSRNCHIMTLTITTLCSTIILQLKIN